MNISAYAKYKVKFKSKICYNTPSYDCLNDWHTEKNSWTKVIEGWDLLKQFAKYLTDNEICDVCIENNKAYFSFFDCHHGETSDFWYEILEEIV